MTPSGSSPRTAVLALVSGLLSRDRANRDLMMLQCFVDDSGHNTGPVLVLAGFIASVDTLLEFSDDWQAVLDLPPSFDYLRMREAWGGRYPSWTVPERDDRLRKFYDVIIKHAVGAIRVAVPREPYKRGASKGRGGSLRPKETNTCRPSWAVFRSSKTTKR